MNKTTYTTNETMADTFNSQREATDYIRKHFSKKQRKYYKSVYIGSVIEPMVNSISDIKIDTSIIEAIKSDDFNIDDIDYLSKTQEQVDRLIQAYLNPEIERHRVQLIKYEDIILDLRHYIRDENTKANACWGYKIFKALQDVERKRAECKKELQRVVMLKNKLEKALTDTKDFDYEPYKYRVIEDIDKYISDPEAYKT